MKTKQQLTDEWLIKDASTAMRDGFNNAITHAFDEFKERINFYKKYVDEPEMLKDDEPDIEIPEWFFNRHNYENDIEQWHDFNTWLFNYTFGDI